MSSDRGWQRLPSVPRLRKVSGPRPPLVVRGEHANTTVEREQCEAFLRRFSGWGRYGLSAYSAHTEGHVQRLAAVYLERFPVLGIFHTATLESAGFEVVATFRSPHMTIAFTGDLEVRLAQLDSLRTDLRPNPHHEG
jgi:hypothetical protein